MTVSLNDLTQKQIRWLCIRAARKRDRKKSRRQEYSYAYTPVWEKLADGSIIDTSKREPYLRETTNMSFQLGARKLYKYVCRRQYKKEVLACLGRVISSVRQGKKLLRQEHHKSLKLVKRVKKVKCYRMTDNGNFLFLSWYRPKEDYMGTI